MTNTPAVPARIEALARAVAAALSGPPGAVAQVIATSECAGWLIAGGGTLSDVPAEWTSAAERALADGDAGLAPLEDDALGLLTILDVCEDAGEDFDFDTIAGEVRRILTARDRAEAICIGTDALATTHVAPRADESLALEIFDALLSEQLPRLTMLNTVRAEREHDVTPSFRQRFWWRFDGVGADPRAWVMLPAVGALAARYDAARRRLDAVVASEHARATLRRASSTAQSPASAPGPAGGTARVVDLAVARRQRALDLDTRRRLAAADAAPLRDPWADASVVFEDDMVEVRLARERDGTALRVIVFGAATAALDEVGAVRVEADDGSDVPPLEGLAIPTLWWAQFAGDAASWLVLHSPPRRLRLR